VCGQKNPFVPTGGEEEGEILLSPQTRTHKAIALFLVIMPQRMGRKLGLLTGEW
jgi:hypothetical protein